MVESVAAGILLPIGLGFVGFIEPCTIGSTLVFVKVMEGRPPATKLWQVGVFTATRALFIGVLGAVAVLVGSAFIGFQKAMWTGLGTFYVVLRLLFVAGLASHLITPLLPSPPGVRFSPPRPVGLRVAAAAGGRRFVPGDPTSARLACGVEPARAALDRHR